MSGKHFVFVYGTLLRGEPNHALLADCECVIAHAEAGGLMLCVTSRHAGFPYAVLTGNRRDRVRGEVWRVDEPTLARLDVLEGVAAGHYVRVMRYVHDLQTDEALQAWMYVAASKPQPCIRIDSGSWRTWRTLRA